MLILGVIGLVHGLTNMGGSLLLQHAATRYSDKLQIRQNVAMGYAIFAFTQLLVLTIASGYNLSWTTLGMSAVAGATYIFFGRRSFEALSQGVYLSLLNAFMLAIAAMLVWKRYGC